MYGRMTLVIKQQDPSHFFYRLYTIHPYRSATAQQEFALTDKYICNANKQDCLKSLSTSSATVARGYWNDKCRTARQNDSNK